MPTVLECYAESFYTPSVQIQTPKKLQAESTRQLLQTEAAIVDTNYQFSGAFDFAALRSSLRSSSHPRMTES